MIYKPNFVEAEREAYKLLCITGTRELPVKVKRLAKYFPNLRIKTYTWFAKKYNLTLEDVCSVLGSNEGCLLYFKKKKQYLILYNDKVENRGRVRWTIAHELGHYMLRHHEKSNRTVFGRSTLTDEEYDIFEKEANCFARTLLAPPPILNELPPIEPNRIADLCQISFEAANNVCIFFKKGIQMGRKYRNKAIIKLFSNFIKKHKFGKTCVRCLYFFVSEEAHFCPVCGNSNLMKGENHNMIYSKIELNESSMPHRCPRCENEIIVGNYCQICGTYLVNKCTGLDESDYYQLQYINNWHNHEGGCGNLLDGDARFCHICGSISTYYAQGLLENWENEKKRIEETEKHALNSNQDKKQLVATASVFDISDDDLPF